MAPAFEQQTSLPVVDANGARATVIMGSIWGETAPTTCHAPTLHAEIVLSPSGSIAIESVATERAVMLVEGAAELDGTPLQLHALHLLGAGHQPLLGSEKGARLMLLGGEPLYTPRHIWWNFVHSSPERIREAIVDWQEGRFPPVPGDQGEQG
jgi:redox-sensitive bicupin YhaK (pirin superfamily)